MSKLYVNQIFPQSGDLVEVSGNLHVSGTLNAYKFETITHNSTTYRGSNTFGNDSGDTTTFTSQLTASQGALFSLPVRIADDKQLYFGNGQDASMLYDESGSDKLIFSGAAGGTMFQIPDNSGEAFEFRETDNIYMTFDTTNSNEVIKFHKEMRVLDDIKLEFGTGGDASIEYDEDGTDELIISGALGGISVLGPHGVTDSVTIGSAAGSLVTVDSANMVTIFSESARIADDKKLYFGTNEDASIEYDEDGTDELIISGSLGGISILGPMGSTDSVTLGSAAGSLVTVDTANMVTILNESARVADDKKLYFGTNEDASFEYDEDGTDTLLYTGASFRISDDVKLEFGDAGDASIEYDEDGTDELIISGSLGGISILGPMGSTDSVTLGSAAGSLVTVDTTNMVTIFNEHARVTDDKKLYFGAGEDASIEYDEDGTDELRFAGAAATFEQAVTFDANVTLGDAAADVVTVTGQLTASEGLNLPDNEKFSFGTGAQTDMYLQNTGTTGSLSSSLAFDINMANDTANAFTIKDSGATYLKIDTRASTAFIQVGKEFSATTDTPITFGNDPGSEGFKLKSTGATGSLSSSVAFDISLADDTQNAFRIYDSGVTYLSVDTRADEELLQVNKELNATNNIPFSVGTNSDVEFKSTGTTGSLSSSVAFEVYMADDTGHTDSTKAAFTFKDSASSYLTFNTRVGQEMMLINKEFNASNDTPITLGNNADVKIKSTGTTGSLSSSVAFEIYMADNVGEDDGTNSAFIFKSSDSEYLSFNTRAGEEGIAISKPVEHNSATGTAVGGGFNGAEDGGVESIYVSQVNGEIVTTILVNIDDLVDSGTVKDIIGENGVGAAYLTQITTAVNGIVYKAEMACIEDPAGSNCATDIDLVANTNSLAEDAEYDSGGGDATALIPGTAAWESGTWRQSASGTDMIDLVNAYLYLANGTGANSGGTYTAGKFIIKLYGADVFGT